MTKTTAAATWKATLGQLELLVTRANYDTWLRETVGLRHEDGAFVIGAHTDFATEWLGTRLRPLIAKTLARVLGHPIEVIFEVIRPHTDDMPVLLPDVPGAATAAGATPSAAAPAGRYEGASSDPAVAVAVAGVVPPALNPALTFDSFVVGDENRLAYEAARSVPKRPGVANPLVIFGSSGLGKTHLIQAIGHAAYAAGQTVIYAPAERFGNDYVRALASGRIEAFRQRYRGCDLLLIDDVQFFEGKEKFQEELFHTFNDLQGRGRQIVLTADRAPSQLTGLMDAMRSRLSWGLVADLQKPSYETRLAILRAKAQQHAVTLPDAALVAIAERCCPTVRELEGYLNRVIAFAPLVGGELTNEQIEKALSPLVAAARNAEAAPPDAETIIAAVTKRTGVAPGDLRGRSRTRDVAYARHLAMFLLREDGRRSVADIGRLLGNRDHSTVLGGISRIALERTTRAETSADIAAIRAALTPAGATGSG